MIAAVTAASLIALGAVALPAAAHAAPADTSCRTIPVDADPFLKSDAARDEFGVDGTGVKVGIISNSYNVNTPADAPNPASPALTSADQNIADGLLPGAGNPCGYTQEVKVVREMPTAPGAHAPVGTDEGRAMAQMVHGIAPGAELYFASAGLGVLDTAGAIQLLIDAGVDVIVDDVIGYDEPWFQQSASGTMIERATALGITYFTAAGNNNAYAQRPKAGQSPSPVSGWRTSAYRPTVCEPTVEASILALYPGRTVDCMDFDRDPSTTDTVSTFETLPIEMEAIPGTSDTVLPLAFQWGEPWGGAKASFGITTTTNTDTTVLTAENSPTVPVPASGVPYFEAYAEFDTTGHDTSNLDTDLVELEVSIFRFTDGAPETLIEPPIGFISIIDGSQWAISAEHWRSEGPDVVGATVSGHNGAPAALTVAAAGVEINGAIEAFSSVGPVTYFFTPQNDTFTAERLAEPVTHSKPDVLSIDGARQNALWSDVETAPGVYRFEGTSAASPNAAGVAALALQMNPALTPADVRRLISETATPVASPYPVIPAADVVGAGLIDARALVAAVEAALPVPPTPSDRPVLAATGSTEPGGVLILGALTLLLGAGAVALRRRTARQS